MEPTFLDHIALWVEHRDRLASFLTEQLDVHIVDRTERYTLIGPDAKAGKLTLFDAPEGDAPHAGRLVAVVLAEDEAREPLVTPDGLTLTFAAVPELPRHSVVGLTLRSADPSVSAAEYESRFGLTARSAHRDVAVVAVGERGQVVTLVREDARVDGAPMLNHLGLLVASADEQEAEARERGLDVLNLVETDNTSAIFVRGPEDVTLEYIEHKPAFALR